MGVVWIVEGNTQMAFGGVAFTSEQDQAIALNVTCIVFRSSLIHSRNSQSAITTI